MTIRELDLLQTESGRLKGLLYANLIRQREIITELFEKKHGVKVGDSVHITNNRYNSDYKGVLLGYGFRDNQLRSLYLKKLKKNGEPAVVTNEITLWGGETIVTKI